jgi:hypothetical protein
VDWDLLWWEIYPLGMFLGEILRLIDRGVYFPVYEKCKQYYVAPGMYSFFLPLCVIAGLRFVMSILFDRKSLSSRTLKTMHLDISDPLLFFTFSNSQWETNYRSSGIPNTHLLIHDRWYCHSHRNKSDLGRKNSINGDSISLIYG